MRLVHRPSGSVGYLICQRSFYPSQKLSKARDRTMSNIPKSPPVYLPVSSKISACPWFVTISEERAVVSKRMSFEDRDDILSRLV